MDKQLDNSLLKTILPVRNILNGQEVSFLDKPEKHYRLERSILIDGIVIFSTKSNDSAFLVPLGQDDTQFSSIKGNVELICYHFNHVVINRNDLDV